MIFKLLRDLWSDEAGYMVSSELILLSTVGVVATGVGYSFLQAQDTDVDQAKKRRQARQEARENENENRRNTASRSVDRELRDVANAIGRINQSYYYHGASGFRGANGIPKAATAGSFFIDYEKEAANDEERAERQMFNYDRYGFDYDHRRHGERSDGFRAGHAHFHRGGPPHHRGKHPGDMKHNDKRDGHGHKPGAGDKGKHKDYDADSKKHDGLDERGERRKGNHHKDHDHDAHKRGHHHGPGHGHHRGHAHGRGHDRGHFHRGHAWGGVSTAAWNRAYAAGRRAALGVGFGVAGRYGFGAAYDDFCGCGGAGFGYGAGYGYGRRFGYGVGGGIRTGLPEGGRGFGYGYGTFGIAAGNGFATSHGLNGVWGAGGSSYRRIVFRSIRPVCEVAAMEAQAAAADAIIARMNEPKIFKCTDDCVPPAPAGRTFIAPEAINPPLYYLPSFDYPAPVTYPQAPVYGW